jgi:hypothetical protein
MTAPELSPQERARVAAIEAAEPTPPEVVEAGVLEQVARAILDSWDDAPDEWDMTTEGITWTQLARMSAVAAITAYRATQDGGASAKVCPTCVREGGPYRCCTHCADDPDFHKAGMRNHHDLPCSTCLVFATQAGDGAR